MRVIKILGLMVLGVVLFSGKAEAACSGGPTTWTAAAMTRAAVAECLAASGFGNGDTMNVPAGTATDWTSTLSISGLCVSIIGAGAGNSIIQENYSKSTPAVKISTVACSSGQIMRFAGFEFVAGSTGNCASNCSHIGTVTVEGTTASLRLDHNKFTVSQQMAINISGYVRGVVDHNTCVHTAAFFCVQANHEYWLSDTAGCSGFNGSGCGDRSWASPLPRISNTNQIFYEDNTLTSINGSAYHDCSGGAREVFRFNVQTNAAWNQHDEARGGRGSRACLNFESYRNLLISDISAAACCGAWTIAGGTGMVWDNDHERRGGFSGFSFVGQMQDYRRWDSPRHHYVFGSVGKWPITSITCTGGVATATVTNTAGNSGQHLLSTGNFAGSLTQNHPYVYRVIIESSSVTGYNSASNPNSVNGQTPILSVPNTSTFTFAATCGGTGTGATLKQPWDQNSDSTGYRAMSQPGAGPSVYPDMVSGTPTNHDMSFNYAVQALMPIYAWSNRRDSTAASGTPTYAASAWTCDGGCAAGGIIVANRDYYQSVGASCTAGGACTSGVGVGTTLPTTCTAGTAGAAGEGGVFFWKTNEGSWNNETAADHANHLDSAGNSSHTQGQDGQGYRCTSTNTWTLDYIPADYPHFLITGADPPSNSAPIVTMNAPTTGSSTTATTLNASGDCVDNVVCTSTTIANSLTAFSGSTTTGPTPWTHSALALDLGINPITVTGSDGTLTGNVSASVFRDDCGSGFPYTNAFSLYADGTAWGTLGPCFETWGAGNTYQIVGNKAVSMQAGVTTCTAYTAQDLNADQSVSATMGQIGAGQQVRLAVRMSGTIGASDIYALLFNVSPSFIWLGRYNGPLGLDLFYATWSGLYTPVANVTTARIEVQGTVAHVYLDIDGGGAGAEVELDDGGSAGIDISTFANTGGRAGVCLVGLSSSFDSLSIDNVAPAPADTTPPVVTIDEPLQDFATTDDTLAAAGLNGTVTDADSGPASCQYQNSASPGFVSLTLVAGDWENAAAIPLMLGINTLTVRCFDVDGNFHTAEVPVLRNPIAVEQTRPARRLRLSF